MALAVEQLRYAEQFSGAVGTVVFPLRQYEYEPSQGYRVADRPAIGLNYAVDMAGQDPWAKDVGIESVRFMLTGDTPAARDAQFESIVNGCRNGGLGSLYTIDSLGARRWAYAKLDSRPGYSSRTSMWGQTAVTLRFRRYSDWQSVNPVTGTIVASASPTDFVLTNTGNAPVEWMAFRFRSNSAAGFNAPLLTNLTNAWSIGSTRVAAATTHEVRIDTERMTVEWSTDDGGTYADDYASRTIGAKQAAFMRLEVGANAMRLTSGGTPSMNLDYVFSPAYH